MNIWKLCPNYLKITIIIYNIIILVWHIRTSRGIRRQWPQDQCLAGASGPGHGSSLLGWHWRAQPLPRDSSTWDHAGKVVHRGGQWILSLENWVCRRGNHQQWDWLIIRNGLWESCLDLLYMWEKCTCCACIWYCICKYIIFTPCCRTQRFTLYVQSW